MSKSRNTMGLLALAAVLLVPMLAAADGISGAWDVATRSVEGDPMSGVVTLKEEGGKLSGTVSIPQGTFPMIEPRLSGQTLTFKLVVEDRDVAVEVKFSGDSLEGSWTSGPDRAPVKGTRKR
jgi:hypothetical protein